jgi:hypothetical protein
MNKGIKASALCVATLALFAAPAHAMDKKSGADKPGPVPRSGGFTADPQNGGPQIKAIEQEAIVFIRHWIQAEVRVLMAERKVLDVATQLADSHQSMERAKAIVATAKGPQKEGLETIIEQLNEWIPGQEQDLEAAQAEYRARIDVSNNFKVAAKLFLNIKAGNTVKAINLKKVATTVQRALPTRAQAMRAKAKSGQKFKDEDSDISNVIWQHAAATVVAAVDAVIQSVPDYQKRLDEKDMDEIDLSL